MAISKILSIGDCGNRFHGKHMKKALEYICQREKTGNGRYIAGLNCQPEYAYEQMRQTKKDFGKVDKRQAYHLVISFKKGEVEADTAFEVIGRFAREYLGRDYEAVYTVHNDTEHIHGHIIFNSVSFRDGRKYHYKKGDWARYIQPITNRLCEEYGLSTIEISDDRVLSNGKYTGWKKSNGGKEVWSDMIKRDLDACILLSPTYDSFIGLLKEKGYEVKNDAGEGKYLAVKPPGMVRFRRCKSLGEEYTEEQIRQRIVAENLSAYREQPQGTSPRIVTCRVRRYRRARLSGLQKRYFSKLYRTGKLKKKAYSQVWKYKKDIQKMKQLQEEYLFLARHDIRDMESLLAEECSLTDKKKSITAEKRKLYRERYQYQYLFDTVRKMEDLGEGEQSYQAGDTFFLEEHEKYVSLQEELRKEKYSPEEIYRIKDHFREQAAAVQKKERAVKKELAVAKHIREEQEVAGEYIWQEERNIGKGQAKGKEEPERKR